MKKMPQKNTEQFNALKTGRINTIPIFDGELELDILANIAFNPKLQHKILYLTEDDFYSPVAINIYSIFYALYKKENVIDISAVRKQISFYHLVNRQYSVIPSQFDLQLKKLKELTYKRILQDIAYRITIMVEEGKGVDEIRNFYDSSMRKVVIKKDELDVDEEFENYITQKSLPVIKTGFPKLDRFTGGFMRGTYSIIASAQGVGKSTLLLNFLSYICGKQNKKVLYI
ncbi:DnaB-like helicase C-terminal domain-containing protein, partial [Candidatus Infernicultor aquiphilus]|uniref:DnaB-like helicase C-terminal domain-containing protein n=1 Tax=Candidatus Infernicultor aquiphilus TaxID=1805029 RepID=UPI003873809D